MATNSITDAGFALLKLLTDGIWWLIRSTIVGIFNFVRIPFVNITLKIFLILLACLIAYKLWKNRGNSLYNLKN